MIAARLHCSSPAPSWGNTRYSGANIFSLPRGIEFLGAQAASDKLSPDGFMMMSIAMIKHQLAHGPHAENIDTAIEAFDSSLTGAEAFLRFCTPSVSLRRAPNHDELVERARYHLRTAEHTKIGTSVGTVQTYTFRPDNDYARKVLVVHGWSGEAAFMGAFGEYLRRRGYCAVLMDMPAHGDSEGHTASLFDCAQAIVEIAGVVGPFPLALGHSIGALALLAAGEGRYPLRSGYGFDAYALVAVPDEFADVTRAFGEEWRLAPAAFDDFERRLEDLAGRSIDEFAGSSLLTALKRPALLLHSRDDTEVSFSCSERIARSVADAELLAFDNLGHRAILYAPQVVRAATAYFDRMSVDAQMADVG